MEVINFLCSTKALGHIAPPKSSYEEVEPGIVIPLGKPENTEHQVNLLFRFREAKFFF